MKTLKKTVLLFTLSLTMTSCFSTRTAVFDQYSYQKTTELKVVLSELMGKATTPYSLHRDEIETVLFDIEKLKEYEKNKPNNQITFILWEEMTDEEKNLLSGFFKRWKTKETLSPVFLKESKKQVLEALDLIIQYEIKKDKESKNELLKFLELQ